MMPLHDGDSQEGEVNRQAITWFLRTAAGVIVVMLINWVLVRLLISEWPDRGSYGDMFGAANTLFSGLAFAGVIYAILLQRHELKLQREELTSTREELKRSADAQALSEEALREQVRMMVKSADIQDRSRESLRDQATIMLKSAEAQLRSETALREQAQMMLITAQVHGYTTAIAANEAEFKLRKDGPSMTSASIDDIAHAWRTNLEHLQQIMGEIRALQIGHQREPSTSTSSVDNNSK